jgi:hypothetical protein
VYDGLLRREKQLLIDRYSGGCPDVDREISDASMVDAHSTTMGVELDVVFAI